MSYNVDYFQLLKLVSSHSFGILAIEIEILGLRLSETSTFRASEKFYEGDLYCWHVILDWLNKNSACEGLIQIACKHIRSHKLFPRWEVSDKRDCNTVIEMLKISQPKTLMISVDEEMNSTELLRTASVLFTGKMMLELYTTSYKTFNNCDEFVKRLKGAR